MSHLAVIFWHFLSHFCHVSGYTPKSVDIVCLLWPLPSPLLAAVLPICDLCSSLQQTDAKNAKRKWFLKIMEKKNNFKLWPRCHMFWYCSFSAVVARRVRLNYCGVLHSSLPLSSPPAFWASVLFLINILLWWVTLPFIYRQLLPDNVFFFPPPLKGEQPILSRMLMPCKSTSEAELRGSKPPSLLLVSVIKKFN